ncbi:MAG TPA: hypothetical protein VKZ53_12985 [Candidatus Angelobacter sp.]|nr:hypothetical protein [Candidatus Angelobacter sp.]
MNEAPRLFRCAICGTIKGDGNHWLLVFESRSMSVDGIGASAKTRVCVSHWDNVLALQAQTYPVCGNGHAHVLVDRWLSSNCLEASRKPASEASEGLNL